MKTYRQKEVDLIISRVKNIKNTFLKDINIQLEKLQNLQPAEQENVCECFMPGDPADSHNPSRCRGTKEMDMCNCEGNKSKCDFYPMTRLEAWRQKPKTGEEFFFIERDGTVHVTMWYTDGYQGEHCEHFYRVGNCFPCALFTEEQVQQIALMNQLNTLLYQYAIVNGALASEEEREDTEKFLYWVFKNDIYSGCVCYPSVPMFNSEEVARQAVKDVVKPFCEAHPKFVW